MPSGPVSAAVAGVTGPSRCERRLPQTSRLPSRRASRTVVTQGEFPTTAHWTLACARHVHLHRLQNRRLSLSPWPFNHGKPVLSLRATQDWGGLPLTSWLWFADPRKGPVTRVPVTCRLPCVLVQALLSWPQPRPSPAKPWSHAARAAPPGQGVLPMCVRACQVIAGQDFSDLSWKMFQ